MRPPFRVSPQGGGISCGKSEEIWSYLFSTSMQPFQDKGVTIGVLFGCFGRKMMAIPGLPGGLIIYQGHLFPLKGRL